MKKWKERWREMLPYEKWFEVAGWVLLCPAVILLALDILGAFGILAISFDAHAASRILFVMANACEAVVNWRYARNVAHACIMTAVVFGLGAVWDIIKLFI